METFKILLTLVMVSSIALAFSNPKVQREIFDAWKKQSEKDNPECVTTTGVTDLELAAYWNDYQLSETRNFKCYLECVYENFHFANKDGTANRDQMEQQLDEMTYHIIDMCDKTTTNETDPCGKVYGVVFCALDTAKKNHIA